MVQNHREATYKIWNEGNLIGQRTLCWGCVGEPKINRDLRGRVTNFREWHSLNLNSKSFLKCQGQSEDCENVLNVCLYT